MCIVYGERFSGFLKSTPAEYSDYHTSPVYGMPSAFRCVFRTPVG